MDRLVAQNRILIRANRLHKLIRLQDFAYPSSSSHPKFANPNPARNSNQGKPALALHLSALGATASFTESLLR